MEVDNHSLYSRNEDQPATDTRTRPVRAPGTANRR
jgi:hypothetical protein